MNDDIELEKLVALQEMAKCAYFQTRVTKLMLELVCELLTRYGSQDEQGFTDIKNSIREFLRNELI